MTKAEIAAELEHIETVLNTSMVSYCRNALRELREKLEKKKRKKRTR